MEREAGEEGLARRPFRLGVAGATAGVAAFLLAQREAWPPHEDETLALFVGDQPLGDLFDTVLGERGGAPLHFLLVHAVATVSPTLTGLRLLSVAFAVASIPVVAALLARLSDRRTSLVATAIVAASWVTLFHGTYGRMYSLFSLTSALSFLALLRAVDRGGRSSWALWALAAYATLATHQYGAFVIGAQAVYVGVLRLRLRRALEVLPGIVALALVAVAAIPLWRSNLVLASRFDLSIGGELGASTPVLDYLRRALGDFVAGWTAPFALVAALAGIGLVSLAKRRPASAGLVGLAVGAPVAGLAIARVGGSAGAPETRHLIFVLPFFALIVAVGLLEIARRARSRAHAVLAVTLAALIATEIAWGWRQTPALYAGEPPLREAAREAAESWLAGTSAPGDVLFGYDPLYLGTRERGAEVGGTVVPRADPRLALEALRKAEKPLGRGVWVLDASDGPRIVGNRFERLEIPERSPGESFETKVFGPFLIVRTLSPTVTPSGFLNSTLLVQQLGRELSVASSSSSYETARRALESLTGA